MVRKTSSKWALDAKIFNLMATELTTNMYVLISGLPPIKSNFTLAPGVTLFSLTAPISIIDLAGAGAKGFKEWAVLEPFCPRLTAQIESAYDSAIVPGYDVLNRVWLASALLTLRGFNCLGLACNAYSWDWIAGRQRTAAGIVRPEGPCGPKDLPSFEGGLLDFHLNMWTAQVKGTPVKKDFTKDDADWVFQYFNIFNKLANGSVSFSLALEAAIDWRFYKERRSAISRIWAGIEAIFGMNSELKYRLSLLSASLLCTRGEERLRKFEAVKKLYDVRSKAVHGEDLPQDKLHIAMVDSYNLLRDLIISTAEQGHALSEKDFNKAIFF